MKIFIFLGKSASGKDSVFKLIAKKSKTIVKKIIPYTTRPIREGEVDGEDYYFISDEAFEVMKENGKVMEYRTYDTMEGKWTYFTPVIEDVSGCYIMIGTLETLKTVKELYGAENVIPIYINVEDGIRLERALKREKHQKYPNYEEMCRRFLADAKDFSNENLKANNIEYVFYNFDVEECATSIAMCIFFYLANCQNK